MKKETFIGRLVDGLRGHSLEEGDIPELENLWELSGRYKDSYRPDKAKALDDFKARTALVAKRRSSRLVILRSMAAAFVLLVAAALWFIVEKNFPPPGEATVFVEANNAIRSVTLEDGSVVRLNIGSTLEYHEENGKMTGPVFLEGEAFFQVTPRKAGRFTVHTSDTQVSVLGTSFNVRAYPAENTTEVEVEEGKVAFSSLIGSSDPILIGAMQKGVFKQGELYLLGTTPSLISRAWREPELSFRNTPMKEVVLALERYYDVDLQLANPDLFDCPYTSPRFNPEEVHDILSGIALTLDGKLDKQEENRYTLQGGTCASLQ